MSKAADFLKEDILQYSKQLEDSAEWRPTYDNLLEKIPTPESLELIQLLKNRKSNVSSKIETLIESLATDIIFSIYIRQIINNQKFRFGNGSAQYYRMTRSH